MDYRDFCTKTGRECYGSTELPLLFEISRLIINSRFLKDALPPIMELISKYLNAEDTNLSILNRDSSRIFLDLGDKITHEDKKKVKYNVGEGITGVAVKTGEPVYVEKISADKRFLNKRGIDRKTRDNKEISFICVPVKVENEILGTISINKIHKENFNPNEVFRVLSVIGTIIAQAVKARQDRLEEVERLKEQNLALQEEIKGISKPSNMVGNSAKIAEVFKLVNQVAKTNATILIRGESGVGKELIAESIHNQSLRKNAALIKINCSAIPESLIESELFGYEKGAFTGADMLKKGRFELADKGTIFLDEIGDLPASVQVKLLRVIQEKEFERLGGTKTIGADVRIIAATNRNQEELIVEDKFREDLYYRINVFPIYVPPLRERLNDIPLLVDHFIQKSNHINNTSIKRISSSALEMLMIYHWPGNIRELENTIERAAILSTDGVIRSNNMPPTLQTANSTNTQLQGTLESVVARVEKQLIIDTLTNNAGNVSKSAKVLGITPRILGLRIEKYSLEPKKYKNISLNSTD